jgi:hypothetical protein
VEHGEVFPGILAELGVAVDVHHGNVEIGNADGPLEIPRFGKILIRNDQFPPELFVGSLGHPGKETPVKPLDKLEGPHYRRMGPPVLQNGLGKFLESGKGAYFPGDYSIVQKRE